MRAVWLAGWMMAAALGSTAMAGEMSCAPIEAAKPQRIAESQPAQTPAPIVVAEQSRPATQVQR